MYTGWIPQLGCVACKMFLHLLYKIVGIDKDSPIGIVSYRSRHDLVVVYEYHAWIRHSYVIKATPNSAVEESHEIT